MVEYFGNDKETMEMQAIYCYHIWWIEENKSIRWSINEILILIVVLEKFQEIQIFSEGDYVTASFIPIFISELRSHLEPMIDSYYHGSELHLDLNPTVKESIYECVYEMNNIFRK